MSAMTARRWYHDPSYSSLRVLRGSVFAAMSLAVCVATVAAVLVGAFALSRASCHHAADAIGADWRWGVFTSCLVEAENGWVPLDNLRFNADGTVAS